MATHGLHRKVQEQFTGSADEFCINPLAIFICNLYSRHVEKHLKKLEFVSKSTQQSFHGTNNARPPPRHRIGASCLSTRTQGHTRALYTSMVFVVLLSSLDLEMIWKNNTFSPLNSYYLGLLRRSLACRDLVSQSYQGNRYIQLFITSSSSYLTTVMGVGALTLMKDYRKMKTPGSWIWQFQSSINLFHKGHCGFVTAALYYKILLIDRTVRALF